MMGETTATDFSAELASLVKNLEEAVKAHHLAIKDTANARNNECTALNRINEIQRAIDRGLEKIRQQAPRESDWKRSQQNGSPA